MMSFICTNMGILLTGNFSCFPKHCLPFDVIINRCQLVLTFNCVSKRPKHTDSWHFFSAEFLIDIIGKNIRFLSKFILLVSGCSQGQDYGVSYLQHGLQDGSNNNEEDDGEEEGSVDDLKFDEASLDSED